jgi:hypothetical protein
MVLQNRELNMDAAYPKMLYHRTQGWKIVNDRAAQDELGSEWREKQFTAGELAEEDDDGEPEAEPEAAEPHKRPKAKKKKA